MKQIIALFLCLLLTASLGGCASGENKEPEKTIPTLPTLSGDKSPLELLTEALEKTDNATSFSMDFVHNQGSVIKSESYQLQKEADGCKALVNLLTFNGGIQENRQLWYQGNRCWWTNNGTEAFIESSDLPYSHLNILQNPINLITNQDLLADFCALPLTISPSEDGSFLYQALGLDWETFSALLYGSATETPQDPAPPNGYQVMMVVDANGYLSCLHFDGGAFQVRILLSEINKIPTPTQPDWVP